jgi:hypothetical protein
MGTLCGEIRKNKGFTFERLFKNGCFRWIRRLEDVYLKGKGRKPKGINVYKVVCSMERGVEDYC